MIIVPNQRNVLYGDGSDGAVTISSNTTITRNMCYTTLTVQSTFTLTTARFMVSASSGIVNAGTIQDNGNSGSGSTAGTALVTNFYSGNNSAGGAGATNAVGTSAAAAGSNGGGSGGTGGSGGANAGGAGGTASVAPTNGSILSHNALPWIFGGFQGQAKIGGGGGGGGGGSNNASATGGGGGGGGGTVCLSSPSINNLNGTIRANGGAGGNASGSAGDAGGGGGGGGGLVVLIYDTLIPGTEQATAGALGTSFGAGGNASPGSAGNVLKFRMLQ